MPPVRIIKIVDFGDCSLWLYRGLWGQGNDDNGLLDNGLVDNGLVDNGLVDNGLVDNGRGYNGQGDNGTETRKGPLCFSYQPTKVRHR